MARRFISVGAVVALMLTAGVVTASGASAAPTPPVNAHGSLHCSISGKVKFTPTPLTFGGPATSTTFSASVKSASCSGSSGVTFLKGTLSATLPTTDCNGLLGALPPTTLGNTKVKGAAKYNPTTVSYTSGGAINASAPITMDEPGTGSSTVSGSFAGQHPSIHLVSDQTATTLLNNCTPKTKGVKGSGGLKKLSFNTNSFIDIPA